MKNTFMTCFSIAFLSSTAFGAENCISGYQMENASSQVSEQHSFYYQWQQASEALPSAPNRQFGMFLYVPALGDYIRGFDWEYCPSTNTVRFPQQPLYTRTYQKMVYGDTLVIVEYKPSQAR